MDTNTKDKLTIRYVSDIHTEFGNFPDILPSDVLILAGDIGSYGCKSKLLEFLKYVSSIATHVLYVLGNHEYYGSAIDVCKDKISSLIDDNDIDNIHLLELDTFTLMVGKSFVTFFGCTLWTDIDNHTFIQYNMNDYVKIRGPNYTRLTTQYVSSVHKVSVMWLDKALTESRAHIKIVVTHHMPYLVSNSGDLDPYTSAYRSDLSELMGRHRIPLWIYGHTHEASDVIVSGTRCVSNPLGYPGESTGYRDSIIEIM